MVPVAAIIDTVGKNPYNDCPLRLQPRRGLFLPAGQGDIKSVLYR